MLMRFFLFNMMMSNTFLASATRISQRKQKELVNRLMNLPYRIVLLVLCIHKFLQRRLIAACIKACIKHTVRAEFVSFFS